VFYETQDVKSIPTCSNVPILIRNCQNTCDAEHVL